VVPLRLPPLRERSEDVPDLARHFFKRAAEEGLPEKRVTPEGLERMRRYPWPGNVRELENMVRRLAALYPQEEIGLDIVEAELKADMAPAETPAPAGAGDMENVTIAQAVEQNMQRYFASFGAELPPPGLYHRVLAELEYPLILACLTATRGNQIKAADLLGLNRNTLRKKIRELGVNIYRGSKGI